VLQSQLKTDSERDSLSGVIDWGRIRMGRRSQGQGNYSTSSPGEVVPDDHLVRTIRALTGFGPGSMRSSRPTYSQIGRPSIDPVLISRC